MIKFWRIAWHEYSRHALRRRFLFALLSVPLIVVFMVVMILVITWLETDNTRLGYIDRSGLLVNPLPGPAPEFPERKVPLIPYTNEAEARAALEAEQIQGYYTIPADYLQRGQASLIYLEQPSPLVQRQFFTFLAVNLLASQPPQIAKRLNEGNAIVVRTTDESRQASQENPVNILLPFIAGLAFIFAIFNSGGYLMQALVEEKENRTMEIIVTSASPNQLMIGKTVGDIAIGLTQLIAWGLFIVAGILIGRDYAAWLQNISISWEIVGIILAILLPAFIMIAALMAAIGATIAEAREGQQISGLLTLPVWIPYLLIGVIAENPNGPVAVALSFFPLSAPMTVPMRASLTVIPTWQIIASVFLMVISAIGALWLAGKAFRLGMLRYGQRLRWTEILRQKGG
jgi:ABC-2 type transport system permease protein